MDPPLVFVKSNSNCSARWSVETCARVVDRLACVTGRPVRRRLQRRDPAPPTDHTPPANHRLRHYPPSTQRKYARQQVETKQASRYAVEKRAQLSAKGESEAQEKALLSGPQDPLETTGSSDDYGKYQDLYRFGELEKVK